MKKPTPFDAAEFLKDEETIAEYLSAALDDPNPDVFLMAVRDVARARGMTELARASGLGREGLYKALAPGAKPRYDTVLKVMKGFGVRFSAQLAAPTEKTRRATTVKLKSSARKPANKSPLRECTTTSGSA